MKRSLLLLVFMINVVLSVAQPMGVLDGSPGDSTTFTFEPNGSLNYTATKDRIDTTGMLLWKIGTTSKSFFSAGALSTHAIMTDTSQPYPVNANDWFIYKSDGGNHYNMIISFWHKYQTTAKHDGGLVEYSIDTGNTWRNVMDSCDLKDIFTNNFYSKTDTLNNGLMAFNGTSAGWQYSRFQFFYGIPIKGTAQSCLPGYSLWVRFRFVSDDTLENLDGWIIDDIKIERDKYGGYVGNIYNSDDYKPYPNPSYDGIFYLPELKDEKQYRIEICNTMGAKVFSSTYQRRVDLHALPGGVYFYKVTNGESGYSGKLLLQ